METFDHTLRTTHDWALQRIQVLCETCDVESVTNACSIHDEFEEWFDPNAGELDVCSLAYIGEGSEYV
tara:strand:- start:247 stop:450 length:204 start_codon:yes stop_codon:yes gene_type:complete